MSHQESRISDEEFERRLNAKSYDNQWRGYSEQSSSGQAQTIDYLYGGQRQQSGQKMLSEMKEFEEQKQLNQYQEHQQQLQQQQQFSQNNNNNSDMPQITNPNQVNPQRLNTSKIIFPKDLQFDKFSNDKVSAFIYYSNHPKTSHKFEVSDVDTANNLAKSRNTAYLSIYFSITLINYYMTKYLKYKNIPWGITYKFSFVGFLTKYFFFPVVMGSTIDKYFLAPPYQKSMDNILNKYTFSSDPIFREVFESQQKK